MQKIVGVLVASLVVSIIISVPSLPVWPINSTLNMNAQAAAPEPPAKMQYAKPAGHALTRSNSIVPTIYITSPNAGYVLSTGSLTVQGTAQEAGGSGIKQVEVELNGGPYQLATPVASGDWSSWQITFDMTSMQVGNYNVQARVTDNAGNQNWAAVYITYSLYDSFPSTYTLKPSFNSPNGKWYGVWNGAGSFGVKSVNGNNAFYERSRSVSSISQTQSSMALSTQQFKNFELSLDVSTLKQTRLNNSPNSWEVAWIIWHWNDNTHFNYFLVKTDGPETGKYDGGVNPADQKILQTAQSPKAVIGQSMHWDITVKDSHIVIAVNGSNVFDFYDSSSFNSGTIGLYSEDSSVTFGNVNIMPL